MLYREIGITDIEGVLVGHAQRKELGSGCTAVLVEKGALCGCDVRGGSPATRDTQALRSEMSNQKIYGVVLTGGSAYGLNTCTGVMNYLTERGAGTMVRSWRIPVVVGASIFDFPVSDAKFIPGTELGYEAAKNATSGPVEEGCVGGGTGATVSKFLGPENAFKSGIGTYGLQVGDLKVAAINAPACAFENPASRRVFSTSRMVCILSISAFTVSILAMLSAGKLQILISRRSETLLILYPLHQSSGSFNSYPPSGTSIPTLRPSTRPAFMA